MKKPWKILLRVCMLIYFGCSGKIVEDNETFIEPPPPIEDYIEDYTISAVVDYVEPNQISENLTTLGYEIAHFNDTHAEVRNTNERSNDF